MYQCLLSALDYVASWLQSASQAVPVFQLSVMTWVMFVIARLLDPRRAFNAPEQSAGSLSKISLQ
jgi:hypothetical protein